MPDHRRTRDGPGATLRVLWRAGAGLVVTAAVVLAVELQIARTRPKLPPAAPLRLDGPLGAGAPEATVSIVWLGDSTASGVGASAPHASLPHRVAAALGRPVELTVLARSGARVEDVVGDQLPGVAPLRPDVVVISVGANDTVHLTSRRTFARRYRELLDGLQAVPSVVVLGVPDMGSPPRFLQPLRAIVGWRGRALDAELRAAAADGGGGKARHVDIAGETGPTMRRAHDRYFSADGYHPSDAGYQLWAEAVSRVLQPAIG